MSLKAILTLRTDMQNPSTGEFYSMIGGRIGGDDENYLVEHPFGWTIIPKAEVAHVTLVHEGIELDQESLLSVWFLNDINAAE